MKRPLAALLFLFTILGSSYDGHAQTFEEEFDALLEPKLLHESPGGTAIVAVDGNVLYHKSFGTADLELDLAMETGHMFRIGSITKQFTACAIMRLAEQGKLSLQDSITKFIHDYPSRGNAITLENLLTHTSGIKNITAMPEWTSEVQRKDFTPKGVVDFFKNEPFDFVPGSDYNYSNSNYILLGYIIELVTGYSYGEYLSQNFFQPLGMNHTTCDSFTSIISGRIDGYQKTNGQYANASFLNMTQPLSAGALLSNTSDLNTWYNALMTNKVISKSSWEKAQRPFQLSNGKMTNYGYGWELGNIQGSPSIRHSGKINGFATYSLYLPDEKVFVAIFSNCDCTTDLETVASKIAARAINKPYTWKSLRLSEKTLSEFEGVYDAEGHEDKIVSFEDGRLLCYAPKKIKTELLAVSKDRFRIQNTLTILQFSRDKKGKITACIAQNTDSPVTWMRTEKKLTKLKAIKVQPKTFDQYVGRYQFGSAYFVVLKEDSKLYGKAPGENQVRQEILPFAKHKFFAKNLDAQIRFNVNAQGKVVSLTIIQNGEKTAPRVE
ncbi:MAG: serine hydrolase [Chryseolinea sp.]